MSANQESEERTESVNIGSPLLPPDMTQEKIERMQGVTPTEMADAGLDPEDQEPIEAVDLPNGKVGDVDDDRFDTDSMVWIKEEGCPECGSDVEIFIADQSDFEAAQYKYSAFAEACVHYDERHGCTHRKPD